MKGWTKSIVVLGSFLSWTACSTGQAGSGQESQIDYASSGGGDYNDLSGMTLYNVSSLALDSDQPTINVSSSSNGHKYLVAIVPSGESASSTVQLLSGSASDLPAVTTQQSPLKLVSDPVNPEESEESQFHQFLMEIGDYLNESKAFEPATPPRLQGLTKALNVGDTSSFRVLSSMNSLSRYETVQATLRVKTNGILIYVDNNASSLVDVADLETLVNDFEDVALPIERSLFGTESDINADGTMTILMTPVLNRMASSGGLVTGFFCPCDLYTQSASNPASNQMEIFYAMVPDPSGTFGPSVSTDFTINNILPGVLAHEYQHMTSFQQHVFLHGGSTEVSWLNEALSHFAEDITGFGKENASRVRLALANPQSSPLTPSTSPGLAERGMGYLFMRYLYEQSDDGDVFLANLYNSSSTGTSNIEQAFAGTDPNFDDFNDFVKRWTLALALSETGVTSDPAYNYLPRTTHPETGNYMGVCLRCDAQDGRGTILSGPAMVTAASFPLATTVEASAIQYFLIENPAQNISLNIAQGSSLIGTIAELK